jgi:hypothetical protein
MIQKMARSACRKIHTVILAFLLCLFFFTPNTSAQEDQLRLEEEIDRANYAFAAYLGSGIYTASDGAVQVYSVPLSWTLQPPKENRPGIKFKFPVTLGFYDFKALDITEGKLPDNVATLSVIPGVEFRFPVRENWSLTPFADLGSGWDFSRGDQTWIWSTGLESEAHFTKGQTETTLGNTLQYAAYSVPGEDDKGNFLLFETGLDLQRPIRMTSRGHTSQFSLYLMNQAYFNELEIFRYRDNILGVQLQYEVGVTWIPNKAFKLWLLDIPRIGLGYRFGDGLAAFRLVLGLPF